MYKTLDDTSVAEKIAEINLYTYFSSLFYFIYLFFFFFTTKYLDLSPINFSPNNTAICSPVAIIETSFHPRFWKKRTDSRNDL